MILRKPKRDTRILFLYLFALSLELFILFIVVLSMALIEDDIQKTRERAKKEQHPTVLCLLPVNQINFVCFILSLNLFNLIIANTPLTLILKELRDFFFWRKKNIICPFVRLNGTINTCENNVQLPLDNNIHTSYDVHIYTYEPQASSYLSFSLFLIFFVLLTTIDLCELFYFIKQARTNREYD
jgi:hypothetical protein